MQIILLFIHPLKVGNTNKLKDTDYFITDVQVGVMRKGIIYFGRIVANQAVLKV